MIGVLVAKKYEVITSKRIGGGHPSLRADGGVKGSAKGCRQKEGERKAPEDAK